MPIDTNAEVLDSNDLGEETAGAGSKNELRGLHIRYEKDGPDGLSTQEFQRVVADFAKRWIQIVAEQKM